MTRTFFDYIPVEVKTKKRLQKKKGEKTYTDYLEELMGGNLKL